jgi:hypothetical protein
VKFVIPKTVKVGAKIYTVTLVGSWNAAKGHENFGVSNHGTQEILIDKAIHAQQLEDTFLHELEHVIATEAGFEGEINCSQEELVRRTTPIRHQVFTDNKLFQ